MDHDEHRSNLLDSFPNGLGAVVQGSSRGIGLALVARLLEEPGLGRVMACARAPDSSEGLIQLLDRHEERLILQPLDVTDPLSIEAAADAAVYRGLRPHLVINVAGILHEGTALGPEKRLEDIDLAALERVFAVNVLGPAVFMRHFLPRMATDGKAVFAALSARVGSIGDNRLGGWYAYRASKSALNQTLKTASIEARRRFKNIIVAALHPGTTDTSLSAPFQANVDPEKLFAPEFVAERLLRVLGQLQPEDSGGFFAWDGQSIPW